MWEALARISLCQVQWASPVRSQRSTLWFVPNYLRTLTMFLHRKGNGHRRILATLLSFKHFFSNLAPWNKKDVTLLGQDFSKYNLWSKTNEVQETICCASLQKETSCTLIKVLCKVRMGVVLNSQRNGTPSCLIQARLVCFSLASWSWCHPS